MFDFYLCALLSQVRDHSDRARPWPSQESFDLAQGIIRQSAFEVAVVQSGHMLAQFRTFAEWKPPYNIPGWYIPGGFLLRDLDEHDHAISHIKKDLRGEYKRAGIECDLSTIVLGPPQFLGPKLWPPGTHPVGQPISIIVVCELLAGNVIETDRLKWTRKTIPTDVPFHQAFQDVVFAYLRATPQERELMHKLNSMLLNAQVRPA